MTEIRLVDVTMRDGNQSLWGATGLNTAHMLQAAALTEACGFRAIDFTSSSHMAVAVRYFRNNPWERLRRMAAAMPTTPLQFITTGLRFIAWQQADPEFMRLVYRALQVNGVGRFVLLDPMHEVPAVIEAAKLVKEEGDAEVMAALTFTLSEIHTDQFYADFAHAVGQSPNIDLFYIKDPAGLLSVDRARTLVPAVKAAIGNRPLEIHAHTTVGLGMMTSLEAAKLGISAIHVGVGPGGDGSSLPEANRMVANLEEAGFEVGIDKAALKRLTTYWQQVALAEGLRPGTPQNFDASFLRHQIAGGVMTTIARQLEELGLSDRMDAVIAETGQVRADLGFPIMVTPFPQMVMTQALFNVIGDRRYAQVSDQVIRYCMGKFGKPTSPVDPKVLATIMDRPRARELENEPMFPALADLQRQFGTDLPDEEFLLRAVMPAEQVDAMLAAGRSRATYSPHAAPILSLLRQLAARPHARDIVVERDGFRLALHAGASL
ncbi:biotin carboxyl carrier protein [Novosphingobium sp. ERN07]|uniref:biotin carboxyl carrier protein n=1 Tax=Novosphingobium sp. ERN07 TaxID=2726187 RepID=UPI0014568877|nr:biotin carboxyl carrier protein [Novosphingobium sp. ERN07]NLR69925.1 biotin carboxyl carrier protein [Novosphingobium sp. ERN07]